MVKIEEIEEIEVQQQQEAGANDTGTLASEKDPRGGDPMIRGIGIRYLFLPSVSPAAAAVRRELLLATRGRNSAVLPLLDLARWAVVAKHRCRDMAVEVSSDLGADAGSVALGDTDPRPIYSTTKRLLEDLLRHRTVHGVVADNDKQLDGSPDINDEQLLVHLGRDLHKALVSLLLAAKKDDPFDFLESLRCQVAEYTPAMDDILAGTGKRRESVTSKVLLKLEAAVKKFKGKEDHVCKAAVQTIEKMLADGTAKHLLTRSFRYSGTAGRDAMAEIALGSSTASSFDV